MRLASIGIGAGILAVVAAPGRVAAASPITEFSTGAPRFIAAGPDGNLWFTEFAAIGRISPSGALTTFVLPHGFTCPPPLILHGPPPDTCGQVGLKGITAGPDGNLWFLEEDAVGALNKVGKITPTGDIAEFPIPNVIHPTRITTGPDASLWFNGYDTIGRITLGGTVTVFPIPSLPGQIGGITTGSDGNLWFTESLGNKIGRITPGGAVTEFPIPTSNSAPVGITAGPDGRLWFTESLGKIGQITVNGVITEYPILAASSVDNDYLGAYYGPAFPDPVWIAAGPDGNLWYTEPGANRIGRITPGGTITEFPIPTVDRYPNDIVAGPDGNVWFTEGLFVGTGTGFIGRIAGAVVPEGIATALWRNIQTGDLAVWNMDGVTIKSEELVAPGVPLAWKIAARGDLDANGTFDLIWRDDQTGDVAVWLLKGAVVIGSPVISSGVPLAWRIVGVGDVNGDGMADLIWHDDQTGDVAVWLMDGASVTEIPVVSVGVPLSWQIVGIGDVDGDGKADLVWRDRQTGDVAVWLLNGGSVKQSSLVSAGVPLAWQIVGVGDMNNDGRADLVWRQSESGDVAVWLLNGHSVIQSNVVSSGVPPEWQIAGVLDVNSDGRADLVWRFISQPFPSPQPGGELRLGQAAVWLMNGSTVTQAVLLMRSGPAPEIWQIQP